MSAKMLKIAHETGDTIIEVLIAIAVVSSVLAITYATMNRNLLLTRASQERTEAAKLAQGQIESLRQYGAAVAPSGSFCFKSDGSVENVATGSPTVALSDDDWANYTDQCTVDELYHLAVTTEDSKTFKLYVRWDRVTGKSRDEVRMVYRK